jgi:hypothetical protein
MSTKVILFSALIGLSAYTVYTVVDMKSHKELTSLKAQNTSLDSQAAVLSKRNIETYPAHVQAVYNAIPVKLWKLGNNKNLTSEEIEAEIRRIRGVIGTNLPHISNKFVWIVNNTPVKADLKASPIVYKFDEGKYLRLNAPYSLASVLTSDQVTKLLSTPTDEIVDLTKDVVESSDKAYKEDTVKRNLLDLALTLENSTKPKTEEERKALVDKLKESMAYQTLSRLDENFNIEDFVLNPKQTLEDAKVDYTKYNLFQVRQEVPTDIMGPVPVPVTEQK